MMALKMGKGEEERETRLVYLDIPFVLLPFNPFPVDA